MSLPAPKEDFLLKAENLSLAPPAAEDTRPKLGRGRLSLMAFGTGLTIANLYYCQPLLADFQKEFQITAFQSTWIVSLTMAGFSLALFLIVPLGDMLDRKKLIIAAVGSCAAVLFAFSFAPSFGWALAFSAFLGFASATPQIIIPFATQLADPAERGKVLGILQSSLTLGIVLSRTASGFLGPVVGWRSVYVGASIAVAGLTGALLSLPSSQPQFKGTYKELNKSLFELWRKHRALRVSSLVGGLIFGSFMGFWTNLIHVMKAPTFGLGPQAVAMMGMLMLFGVVISPFIGRSCDKRGPLTTQVLGLCCGIIAVYLMWVFGKSLAGICGGVALFCLAHQTVHVSSQSRAIKLDVKFVSRINTVYMVSSFIGSTAGSYVGSLAWQAYGWTGLCLASLIQIVIAGGIVYWEWSAQMDEPALS